jgi:hypothetical protein
MLIQLATRTSSKVAATAFGIALCVMFLSGSYALLDGLRGSTTKVSDLFDEGPIMAYSRLPLEESFVDHAILNDLHDSFSAVRVVAVNISFGGVLLQETLAASVSNASILGINLAGLNDGETWIGKSLLASARRQNITVPDGASIEIASLSARLVLTFEQVHPDSLLPDDWILVSEGTLKQLAPILGDDASFLLVDEGSADLARLEDAGLTTVRLVAAVDFFRQGVYSLEPVLWGLSFAAGAVIVVLTFTLMAIEVRYRATELRILRQIGATPGFLLRVILLQSIYVSSLGGLLGLALASIVTNAVTSFAPLVGMSTFVLPAPSIAGLGLPMCIALIAGLLGGAFPAYTASGTARRRMPTRS